MRQKQLWYLDLHCPGAPCPCRYSLLISLATSASLVPMVCRNLCLRLYTSTQASGSHYMAGGKYCRTCECYLITQEMFCKCRGMRLRASPHCGKKYKENVRATKKNIRK